MIEARYRYAGPFRSRASAEDALESAFASGDIVPSERPQIVRYSYGLRREPNRADFYITLPEA